MTKREQIHARLLKVDVPKVKELRKAKRLSQESLAAPYGHGPQNGPIAGSR